MAQKQYELDYLEEISGGDEEFVKEMIQAFVDNAPEDIGRIKGLVSNQNWQKAGEEAHRFASSLLFLRLERLKQIAIEIEELGLQNVNLDRIPDLLKELEDGCESLIVELKNDFNL